MSGRLAAALARKGSGLTSACLMVVLLLTSTGCGERGAPRTVDAPTGSATTPDSNGPTPSVATPGSEATTPEVRLRCGPGAGFPIAKKICPDPEPETGVLELRRDGRLMLAPVRTYRTDDEGEAYAEAHDLAYPFSNDYLDVPAGSAYEIRPGLATICTGIIAVGYREPLGDHVVDCSALERALHRRGVLVALWRDGEVVFQISELYRP